MKNLISVVLVLTVVFAVGQAQDECAAYESIPETPAISCTEENLALSINVLTTLFPAACGYDATAAGDAATNGVCDMECALLAAAYTETVLACTTDLEVTYEVEFQNGGFMAASCGGCDTTAMVTWIGLCENDISSGSCGGLCNNAADNFFSTAVTNCQVLFDVDADLVSLRDGTFAFCGTDVTEGEPVCDMFQVVPPYLNTCFSADGSGGYNYCNSTADCGPGLDIGCSLLCVGAFGITAGNPTNFGQCGSAGTGQVSATEEALFQAATFECTGCDSTTYGTALAACPCLSDGSCDSSTCLDSTCMGAIAALLAYESNCIVVDPTAVTTASTLYTDTCSQTAVDPAPVCNMVTFGGDMATTLGLGETAGCWCDTPAGPLPGRFAYPEAAPCSDECQALVNSMYTPASHGFAPYQLCDHQLDDNLRLVHAGSFGMCTFQCDLYPFVAFAGACDPGYLDANGPTDCAALDGQTEHASFLQNCDGFTTASFGLSTYFVDAFVDGLTPTCEATIGGLLRDAEHICSDAIFGVCLSICDAIVSAINQLVVGCPSMQTTVDQALTIPNAVCLAAEGTDGSCDVLIAEVEAPPTPECDGVVRDTFVAGITEHIPDACGYTTETLISEITCPSMACAAEVARYADTAATSCAAITGYDTEMLYYALVSSECGGCPTDTVFPTFAGLATICENGCDEGCASATALLTGNFDACLPLLGSNIDAVLGLAQVCPDEFVNPEEEGAQIVPTCNMLSLVPAFADLCLSLDSATNTFSYCGPDPTAPFPAPTVCGLDAPVCHLMCVAAVGATDLSYLEPCLGTGQLGFSEFLTIQAVAAECFDCDTGRLETLAGEIGTYCATGLSGGSCANECNDALQELYWMEPRCGFAIDVTPGLLGLSGAFGYCPRNSTEQTAIAESMPPTCDMTVFGSLMAQMAGLGDDGSDSCLCNTAAGPLPVFDCTTEDAECTNLVNAATVSVNDCIATGVVDELLFTVFFTGSAVCPTCLAEVEATWNEAAAYCATTDESTCFVACEEALVAFDTAYAKCAEDPFFGPTAVGEFSGAVAQADAWEAQCSSVARPNIVYDDTSSAGTLTLSVVLSLALSLLATVFAM